MDGKDFLHDNYFRRLSFPNEDKSQKEQTHPCKLVNTLLHEDIQPEIQYIFCSRNLKIFGNHC